jgi:hypothetical protein
VVISILSIYPLIFLIFTSKQGGNVDEGENAGFGARSGKM